MILEKQLNFTATYIKCNWEAGWGDQNADGSFSGMVGVLNRNGADLIGASLTMTPTRVRGVSYVHPMGVETYSLIMPSVQR